MKAKKVTFSLLVLAPVLLCLAVSGCGPDNCLTVDAGRPFVAQEGVRYGISEGGPTYFYQSPYSNTQVVYVDPDRYYDLQPGRTYVLLMDTSYPAREAERERAFDDWVNDMERIREESRRSTDDFTRGMRESSERMLNSIREMNRSNAETLDMLGRYQSMRCK